MGTYDTWYTLQSCSTMLENKPYSTSSFSYLHHKYTFYYSNIIHTGLLKNLAQLVTSRVLDYLFFQEHSITCFHHPFSTDGSSNGFHLLGWQFIFSNYTCPRKWKSYCPTNHSLAAAKSRFRSQGDSDWEMCLH